MSVGAVERIGVLGGTFDPPHVGHLVVALDVLHGLDLDRVLMVVANDPWQKSPHRDLAPADVRLAMVRAMTKGLAGLEPSTLEIDRGGESYTADTLATLSRDRPSAELFLVVGSDAAAGLDTWKRPEEIRSRATTVVVDRGGVPGGRPPEGWDHVVIDVPAIEISSSDIRERVATGRPIEALVPAPVVELIRVNGLYRSSR